MADHAQLATRTAPRVAPEQHAPAHPAAAQLNQAPRVRTLADTGSALNAVAQRRAVVQRLHGAGNQPGQTVNLNAVATFNAAAKASALEINRLARTTAQNQVQSSSALGANNAGNYHIRVDYNAGQGGRLETWVELTGQGGGYVKRVRTETPINTVTMDRVMDENPSTALQRALVVNRMGGNNPLTGAEDMASMHGVHQGDAGGLSTAGDTGRSADNITKMVGEGARFPWMAHGLANRTIGNTTQDIFKVQVKIPQAGYFTMNPTFQQMWGSWDSAFGRTYPKDRKIATQTLTTRLRARLRPARDNDVPGNTPLADGATANALFTSITGKAGQVLLMNNNGGFGIIIDLGMTWHADH